MGPFPSLLNKGAGELDQSHAHEELAEVSVRFGDPFEHVAVSVHGPLLDHVTGHRKAVEPVGLPG